MVGMMGRIRGGWGGVWWGGNHGLGRLIASGNKEQKRKERTSEGKERKLVRGKYVKRWTNRIYIIR